MKIELIKENDTLNPQIGDMIITKRNNHFLVVSDNRTDFKRSIEFCNSANIKSVRPYRLLNLETGTLLAAQFENIESLKSYFTETESLRSYSTGIIRIVKSNSLKIIETNDSTNADWVPRKE